jgi:hypothetical protein
MLERDGRVFAQVAVALPMNVRGNMATNSPKQELSWRREQLAPQGF